MTTHDDLRARHVETLKEIAYCLRDGGKARVDAIKYAITELKSAQALAPANNNILVIGEPNSGYPPAPNGCTCYGSAPTVPVYRHQDDHLPACAIYGKVAPAREEGREAVADDKPALPWRPINECPDSDDLYWFLRRDVIDGPRTPESDDIDYWDWFAPCEAPSTTPQPASVVSEDKAKQAFTTWFCLNYPGPHTIISDPNWHAPRIFRQALWSIRNCAAAEPASVVADILTELVAADREYDAADIAASLECRGEREPSKEAVTRLNIAATRREAAITAALQVKP